MLRVDRCVEEQPLYKGHRVPTVDAITRHQMWSIAKRGLTLLRLELERFFVEVGLECRGVSLVAEKMEAVTMELPRTDVGGNEEERLSTVNTQGGDLIGAEVVEAHADVVNRLRDQTALNTVPSNNASAQPEHGIRYLGLEA